MNTSQQVALVAYLIFCVISLFIFPSSLTFALTIVASLFIYPPFAIFMGALSDIFYFSGGTELRATGMGIIVCLVSLLVRYLVKTRIM